jgi:hypothetical protein
MDSFDEPLGMNRPGSLALRSHQPRTKGEDDATMRVVALGLVGLVLVAVVVTIVQQARNSKPWPLKRHEGHWRKWDDDED